MLKWQQEASKEEYNIERVFISEEGSISSASGRAEENMKWINNLLCRIGFHNWSANRGGVRICRWCPAVDRHYGISGYLRKQFELTTTYQRESDAELREEWLKQKQRNEDLKYMVMAGEVASRSTCAKKQLGCVLVLKNTNIITGTNGPPHGLKKCDPCPRLDSHNGSDTQKCRAVHAERQVILKAAHLGLSTCGSTLYSYMGVPCKDCLLELLEAGVAEIVVIKETYYDELSRFILKEWINSGGKFRVVECPIKLDCATRELMESEILEWKMVHVYPALVKEGGWNGTICKYVLVAARGI